MILDTNALSAWIDGHRMLGPVLDRAQTLKLNVISLGEYRFGVLQSRHRSEFENRLALIEREFESLPIDRTTASLYGLVRQELKTQGRPIPYHDVWIAALARQHGLPILSRDEHFDSVQGVERVSW
jgi:tRNA(fMet)-specific endonuclease VapC